MPLVTPAPGTVPAMGQKSLSDREVEARIGAWIRQRMERRGLGVTAAAKKVGTSQGNLSKILRLGRGLGAGLAARVSKGLDVDPQILLFDDPPDRRFFELYVPRPGDAAMRMGRKPRPGG